MTNTTVSAPVVLTEFQIVHVAGGLVYSPVSPIGHGCPTCTSGRAPAFQNQVELLKAGS